MPPCLRWRHFVGGRRCGRPTGLTCWRRVFAGVGRLALATLLVPDDNAVVGGVAGLAVAACWSKELAYPVATAMAFIVLARGAFGVVASPLAGVCCSGVAIGPFCGGT